MPELTVSVRTDFIRRKDGQRDPEYDWETNYQPAEIDPSTGKVKKDPVTGKPIPLAHSKLIAAAGPVSGAQVEIVGATAVAVTNRGGLAVLNTDAVKDSPGSYLMRIRHSIAAQHTLEMAGPLLVDPSTRPEFRIYRQFDFGVELEEGLLRNVLIPAGTTHGAVGRWLAEWGKAPKPVPPAEHSLNYNLTKLPIDWKPVWIGSPVKNGERPRGKDDIDLIVVHHTGGPTSGGAIHNVFLQPTQAVEESTHYVIDVDGHVMKLMDDLREANHAGCSIWDGRPSVNDYSIGIEIVHKDGLYNDAQYQSLLGLIGRLRRAYPTIAAHRVVGHSDITTKKGSPCPKPTLHFPRKILDPGKDFGWDRLEEVGLGMVPVDLEDPSSRYAPTFSEKPEIVLRKDDHDPLGDDEIAFLGGENWPGFIGNPIAQLQKDLQTIGFSVREDPAIPIPTVSEFDEYTESAVAAFQRHIFAGSSRKGMRPPELAEISKLPEKKQKAARAMGRIDKLTAEWISRVAQLV